MDKLQESNKVINYIFQEIYDGRLIEGSRLHAEREMTEQLDVSRTSTREAISILRGMGLVDSRAGSGNYLVNNTDKSLKNMLNIMLKMGSINKQEISSFRRFISRAVAIELLERGIKPEYQKRFEEILEEMHEVSDEEFCRLDREFHQLMIEATENTLFIKVMEPIADIYLDTVFEVFIDSDEHEKSIRIPMHENIYRSIINNDTEACIRFVREHYDYVDKKIYS